VEQACLRSDDQQIVPKELFTVQEVAVSLSLSARTVESLIAQGHLRSAVAPGTERPQSQQGNDRGLWKQIQRCRFKARNEAHRV